MALTLQSMLLASLILLLYWTPSSVESHDRTSTHFSVNDIILDPGSRDKADKALNIIKDFMSLFKDVMEKIDTKKASAVMKGLAGFASLAPGIGLVSSVINMVLVIIPEEDEDLKKVKAELDDVNRKLDFLSIQLSCLETEVEWTNYASTYAQEELRIVNTWKMFDEFRKNSMLARSQEEKKTLTKTFTDDYEEMGNKASVDNFYHYMTVSGTSFIVNINDLLRKKFKCDISEIGKYNLYFSSLLWKAMVVNQLYWNLIDKDKAYIKAKHTKMFDDVYKVQLSAVEFCINNYDEYMKKDVERIGNINHLNKKQTIAQKVKMFLDMKYSWYNWVVVVYNTDPNFSVSRDMTMISVGKKTVAVGHILNTDETENQNLKASVNGCFRDKKYCIDMLQALRIECNYLTFEFLKGIHVTTGQDFGHFPKSSYQVDCYDPSWVKRKISMYFSKSWKEFDCSKFICKNNRWCERVLDSSERICICPNGYYGSMCEKKSRR